VLRMVSVLCLAICIVSAQAAPATAKQPVQQRKTVSKAIAGAKAAQKPVHRVALRQGGKPRTAKRAVVALPPPEIFNPDILDVQSTAALVVNPSNG